MVCGTQRQDRVTDGTWPAELWICNDTHPSAKELMPCLTSGGSEVHQQVPREIQRHSAAVPRTGTALLFCCGVLFFSPPAWLFGSIFSIPLVRYKDSRFIFFFIQCLLLSKHSPLLISSLSLVIKKITNPVPIFFVLLILWLLV